MGKKKTSLRAHRLVLLGSGGVGKSSLTVRFVQGDFCGAYDPTIEDSYTYETSIDGVQQSLEIMDTAGSEQFGSIKDLYLKTGELFILVYDITSRKSFQEAQELRREVERARDGRSIPMVLVGNKCDLEDMREVGKDLADSVARQWQCPHVLTSAKADIRVHDMFQTALRQCIRFKSLDLANSRKQGGCVVM